MRRYLVLIMILHSLFAASAQNNLKLWYNKPALSWNEALPIGNGRLAAMVFGGRLRTRQPFPAIQGLTAVKGEPENLNEYFKIDQIKDPLVSEKGRLVTAAQDGKNGIAGTIMYDLPTQRGKVYEYHMGKTKTQK